jgi:hypothetical protein
MKTSRPYGPGTLDTGDRPDEQLASHAAAQTHPPLEAPAAPANGLPTRAERLPREQASTDQRRPAPVGAGPGPVRSCWMCGIRLSADEMVADGGSACLDLRWYCLDTRACTERWTSRPARGDRPPPGHDGEAEGTRQAGNGRRRRPASAGIGVAF